MQDVVLLVVYVQRMQNVMDAIQANVLIMIGVKIRNAQLNRELVTAICVKKTVKKGC